ncbi:MAG: hypothetical protein CM1200mP41_03750 [Gammaproteobacteria bacterium]|nr:MAG: hypothetical protein CM1200mP41_03750 [Gammaproteobacteria bacterium]
MTVLSHNWRFGHTSGIGHLATAINAGDANGALAYLDNAQMPDIVFRPCPDSAALATLIEQHAISRFEPCLDPTMNNVPVPTTLHATWSAAIKPRIDRARLVRAHLISKSNTDYGPGD